MTSTLPDSFWAKASKSDCIVWHGAQNSLGYGCYGINGVSQLAHRLAWEDANGPIPKGMIIDHLCRVRACVNVAHMELVTHEQNINRRPRVLAVGGQCRNGHVIEGEYDLYRRKRGAAECRECRRIQRLEANARAAA